MKKSFTLIELLIVIAIIAIIAIGIIVLIIPGERLAQARDATRAAHLKNLETALYLYSLDNEGIYPEEVTSELIEICNTEAGVDCTDLVNLSTLGITIPVDPLGGINPNGTGYFVFLINNQVRLSSIKAETQTISVGGPTCGYTISYGGDIYNTVLIGEQCWFKENLNVENGNTAQVCTITRYCYGDVPESCDIYGGLYNWDDTMCGSTNLGAQGICPNGWHIPTYQEWTILTNYLGEPAIGSKMAGNYDLWNDGHLRNNDYFGTSGLDILPGGHNPPTIYSLGNGTFLWSSDESGISALSIGLGFNDTGLLEFMASKTDGLYIRCLKD